MKKIYFSLFIIALYSCASHIPKRENTFSYKILDASKTERPLWISDSSMIPNESEKKDFRFFVSEANSMNKRLCTKTATARASSIIASEAVQFIKESYSESLKEQDKEIESYIENTMAQEVQTFLVGVQVEDMYWEQRGYKIEMGAEKDFNEYQCSAIIKIKKDILEKILKESMNKVFENNKNTETKQKSKDALNLAAEKFVNL